MCTKRFYIRKFVFGLCTFCLDLQLVLVYFYGTAKLSHEKICLVNMQTHEDELQKWSLGYETFLCSTQLSVKFKLLINAAKDKINRNFRFISPRPVILVSAV